MRGLGFYLWSVIGLKINFPIESMLQVVTKAPDQPRG